MGPTMRHGRPHKAFVIVDDDTWLAFRALTLRRRTTVQELLGELVRRELATQARRDRRAEAKRARDRKEREKVKRELGL